MKSRNNIEISGRILSFEIDGIAKQADGAVIIQYGDTMVLVSAVASKEESDENYFFPLTVNYVERTYAAGKIPGGFFKREGRPREKEIISSRMIDRPIRPLFPDGFLSETQIIAMVLSADQENDSDILGIIGASTALTISDIPFNGPIGAVRMGYINGEFVINPTFSQLEESKMDLVLVTKNDSLVMLEGGCIEVDESVILRAIDIALPVSRDIIAAQELLRDRIGKAKRTINACDVPLGLSEKIVDLSRGEVEIINQLKNKTERSRVVRSLEEKVCNAIEDEFPDAQQIVRKVIDDLRRENMRKRVIVEDKLRFDGRRAQEIRPINCEVGVLPRVHGSALFTRGETQSLCAVTLGTTTDQQRVEDLEGESVKTFMLHYNFLPFSVGEVRYLRGPGRREIGHGSLAERALESVLPVEERFPYTIRIVSDILESNGSSSMATVCGSSLALMDAGVPVKTSVAGVSIGLIKEGEKYVILSDIIGDEDHFGDMDFKVAGTRTGITAIQLDTKISDLNIDIIKEALSRAKDGRLYILDMMAGTLKEPRAALSDYAPKVIMMFVPKEKIGGIIGPGGKTIRRLIEETGAEIEISDDGKVTIVSSTMESVLDAKAKINSLIQEIEAGNIFVGKVTRTTNFGAFVEITPGKEGLIHISQLAHHRVSKVEDEVKVGDEVKVIVKEIDDLGRINLSRKAVITPSDSSKKDNQTRQRSYDKYQKNPTQKRDNSSNRKD
ncbi:MAG: polyribonucleotide nucleotidyltransferase [Candidatus Cloacimonadota bacterium]|nr:MAG: polyribonucleotide nucleotidyltransferase [Candidatus Cloacimonadota bacterium]